MGRELTVADVVNPFRGVSASVRLRAGTEQGLQITHMEYFDFRRAVAVVLCAVPSLGDVRAGDFGNRIQALRTAATVYVCPNDQDGLCYEATGTRSVVGVGLVVEHDQTVVGHVNDLVRIP